MAECIPGEDAPTIFTMEKRGDGWDDVRDAILDAKKERVKAVETIKEKYGPGFSSAARWARVIAEEVRLPLSGSRPCSVSPRPTLIYR